MSIETGVQWGRNFFKLAHVWLKQMVISEELNDVLMNKFGLILGASKTVGVEA